MSTFSSSNGDHYAGQYSDLFRAIEKVTDAELRVELLEKLDRNRLCTNDVLSFVNNQAKLRSENKTRDVSTIRQAMKAKVEDSKKALVMKRRTLTHIKKNHLEKLNGKWFKLNRIVKRMTDSVRAKKQKTKLKYDRKYKHLEKAQTPASSLHMNKFRPTCVPSRLKEYSSLPIFETPRDLPQKEPPRGPFIADSSLKFSDGELKLLSRDPKYSLMMEVDELEFVTESERMLSKHRYGVGCINSDAKTGLLGKKETPVKTLHSMWMDSRHKYIFDPFKRSINFNHRRATDCKINKRVKLPRPLNASQEFECELRKRKYLEAYNKYLAYARDIKKKNKNSKAKGNLRDIPISPDICHEKKTGSKKIINISAKENEGMKSLKKRVEGDEIRITATDKSSRMAVLTYEQYMEAGRSHTKKDEKIGWKAAKYFQTQVNNHIWWLANIIGYGEDTDMTRMLKNVHNGTPEVPELSILVKDHKEWSLESDDPVPSRPVLSGNGCINTHLSEIISEVIEPVALELEGGEIQSSEEALEKIDALNKNILEGVDITEYNVLEDIVRKCEDDVPNNPMIVGGSFNVSDLDSNKSRQQEDVHEQEMNTINKVLDAEQTEDLVDLLSDLIRNNDQTPEPGDQDEVKDEQVRFQIHGKDKLEPIRNNGQ